MTARLDVLRRGDAGSAIVEFCFLAVLLMVPLTYIVLTAFRVQSAAYAVSSATREAGRAFLLSPGSGEGAYSDALAAARIAAADHGLELGAGDLSLSCSPDPACPLVAGQRVEVRVGLQVPLPLVPRVFDGRLPASVAVAGEHVESVDRFRADAVPP